MKRTLVIAWVLAFASIAANGLDEWEAFQSEQVGLTFRYPSSILTVSEEGERVILDHRVPYRHIDPCDFKGEGVYVDDVVDFQLDLTIVWTKLPEAMRTLESEFASSRFLSGDRVKTSPGFIDRIDIGSFSGYRLTSGVEGCGFQRYYFEIDDNRTMVVTWATVSELSGSYGGKEAVLVLPGLIRQDQAADLFEGIISTCVPVD